MGKVGTPRDPQNSSPKIPEAFCSKKRCVSSMWQPRGTNRGSAGPDDLGNAGQTSDSEEAFPFCEISYGN